MQTVIAKESKVFSQDYHVVDDSGELKAVFGSESEADAYIYINAAVPVICEKMKAFKKNACDTAETVLTVCRDYETVKTYGDFGETEKLTCPAVVDY